MGIKGSSFSLRLNFCHLLSSKNPLERMINFLFVFWARGQHSSTTHLSASKEDGSGVSDILDGTERLLRRSLVDEVTCSEA